MRPSSPDHHGLALRVGGHAAQALFAAVFEDEGDGVTQAVERSAFVHPGRWAGTSGE